MTQLYHKQLPVVVVWSFTIFEFITVWKVVLLPSFATNEDSSSFTLLNLFFFHVTVALLWVSYYRCCQTDPGIPSRYWAPKGFTAEEIEEAKIPVFPRWNYKNKSLRYCQTCKCFKPPRSHHCHECNKCVVKHDHHCSWIANCVGFYNHKFFLLFVMYVLLSDLYAFSFLAPHAWNIFFLDVEHSRVDAWMTFLAVSALVIALPFMINLIKMQLLGLSTNATVSEIYDLQELRKVSKKNGQSFKWPYDEGTWTNLCTLLGDSVLQWPIPVFYNQRKLDGSSYTSIWATNSKESV